jgi:isoquinoline 1-oxidoreductase alpha subunit
MASFLIYINGEKRQVKVDGNTPLLWVLRDNLKLTGTKYGCGRGLCGACTVHIDGEATRSCITAIENAAGSNFTTIEGLSKDSDHPVQKAWVAEDVPQGGYCQSGQIMTAAAFLERNSNPDESDINAAMKMNICRCGTYQRIRKAIGRAAEELQNG